MTEIGKALALGLWLAFFAWLISTGAPWPLLAFAFCGLEVWWAND